MPPRPTSRRRRRWPVFLAGLVTGEALTIAVAWLYPILVPLVLSRADPAAAAAQPGPRPAPPAAVAPPTSAPAASFTSPASAVASEPAPLPSVPPPLEGPPPDDWGGPKVAMLPQDLGPMGSTFKLALDRARQEDLAFCFKAGGPEQTPRRAADLMLFLETRDGAVDVVDVRVARPGGLPPEVLECCREVLRGMEFKAYFVVPGQRFRYLHEIEE